MKKQQILNNAILCAAAIPLLFVSCGKKGMPAGSARQEALVADYAVETKAAAPRMAKAMMASNEAVYEEAAVTDDSGSAGAVQGAAGTQERKLIKNGSVTIEVQSLAAADSSIEAWCGAFGGYISNSSAYESNAYYTVKIPAARFDEAMKTAGELGTLREHSVSTQDVSEQYYDLQTRLSNKKVMRDNLQKYLAQAKDIKDMLQIEKELNAVVTEIESMEGRMKRLSNQIDYATINVSVQLPYGKTEKGFTFPNMGEGFRKFVSNTVSFFAHALGVFFYIIICGIPVLAIVGFLYWLLWGKVGLLKKLYRWLSK